MIRRTRLPTVAEGPQPRGPRRKGGRMGRRAFKLVPLLIMVATIGLGATWAHADGNQVPFRGSWSGAVVFTGPTTAVFDGTGVATHLGLGTNHGIATITGTDASCPGGLANTNVETLTGAN